MFTSKDGQKYNLIILELTAEDILPMARYKVGTWFIAPAYEKQNGIENLGILVGWEIGI